MKYFYILVVTFSQLAVLSAMDCGDQAPTKEKKHVSFLSKSYNKRSEDEKTDYKNFYKKKKYNAKGKFVENKVRFIEYESISAFHYYPPEYYEKKTQDLLNKEEKAMKDMSANRKKIYEFMTHDKYTTTWQDVSLAEHESHANELKMERIDYYAYVFGLTGQIITTQANIIANKALPINSWIKVTSLNPEKLESLITIKQQNEVRLDQIINIINQIEENCSPQTPAALPAIEQTNNRTLQPGNSLACPGLFNCTIS